jgi:exopolysaccharide production protein ExoZ
MLNNLQALRAFAAISVLTFHFSLIGVTGLPIHPGAFGVDLFFVLSGFIIAYSADRDSSHFLLHRLIRVLPPYWIATFLGFLLVVLNTSLWESVQWLGQSLFFLPGPGGRGAIIFVAWTLVYELLFYGLYAICLRLSRRSAYMVCTLLLLFFAFGVNRIGLPLRPWPLFAEFSYGLVIFGLYRHVDATERWLWGVPLLLIGTGIALLYTIEGQLPGSEGIEADFRRVLVWGLPAAMIVLGLLLWERRGVSSSNRFLRMLGNASYAMYLLHPLLLGLLLPYPPGSFAMRVMWFSAATVVTIALALFYYYLIEVSVIRWLRGRVLKDRPPRVAPPMEQRAAAE